MPLRGASNPLFGMRGSFLGVKDSLLGMAAQLGERPSTISERTIRSSERIARSPEQDAPKSASLGRSGSDLFHDDVVCVLSESPEIAGVRGEHCSAGLGQGDDERIDCGASPCQPPQQRSSPGQRLTDLLHDVARLEKAVRESVAARMAVQTLHEHDGGNKGRPQTFFAKCKKQRRHLPGPLGQTADSARIEDQHDGQPA